MLPRKNRISRKEFPVYSKQGIRVFSPLFSAVIYPKEKGVNVSVVVSKKTAPKAVVRNSVRRHFYAIIEQYLGKFSHGATIVFYPKTEALNASFDVLKTEITHALHKAQVL